MANEEKDRKKEHRSGNILKRLSGFIDSRDTLDSKVFAIILVVGALITGISTLATFVEGMGLIATLSTGICCLFIIAIGIASYRFGKEKECHLILSFFLNFILVPVTFFMCGGVKSGMTLYFMTCLYIIVPSIANQRERLITFIVSVLMFCTVIYVSTFVRPDWVKTVNDTTWYYDVIMSLVLNAICIYYMSQLTIKSYENERNEKDKLNARLEQLAVMDELTGLYNRREMFKRLGNKRKRGMELQRFLVMLDIDNFKKVNDTYGHIFGDKVLIEVSQTIKDSLEKHGSEFAARYGGEEFLYILFAMTREEAYERAEKIREAVYDIKYTEHKELRVSISCGFVDFPFGEDINETLKQADVLLYKAKNAGKNRIES